MGEEIYYLAGKLMAVVVTAIWLFETADIGILVIRMLIFGCLFALQLLLSQIKEGRWKKWCRLCQIAALIWALMMGIGQSFIIVVVVSMELLDGLTEGSLFYEIGGVLLLYTSRRGSSCYWRQYLRYCFCLSVMRKRKGSFCGKQIWSSERHLRVCRKSWMR